jgi:hypothetical protein
MRVNRETKPGQAASGHKLTISEVLAEYLRAEKSRLAPKTLARYTDVIGLFTHSLNGYAANSLSQFERARFDKHFNAEGEEHREFCDLFGPEHILANVGEFLNYFMVSKVIVGAATLRASGTVMKKLRSGSRSTTTSAPMTRIWQSSKEAMRRAIYQPRKSSRRFFTT